MPDGTPSAFSPHHCLPPVLSPSPGRRVGMDQPTHPPRRRLTRSPPVVAQGDGQGQPGSQRPLSLPKGGLGSPAAEVLQAAEVHAARGSYTEAWYRSVNQVKEPTGMLMDPQRQGAASPSSGVGWGGVDVTGQSCSQVRTKLRKPRILWPQPYPPSHPQQQLPVG